MKLDQADILFSKYIRMRDKWTCQRCGKNYTYQPNKQGLHCSHFYGRRYESTRFSISNADALCYSCHNYFHDHPDEYTDFKRKQLGELNFDCLKLQANLYKKKDRKGEVIKMKLLLKELEVEDENNA